MESENFMYVSSLMYVGRPAHPYRLRKAVAAFLLGKPHQNRFYGTAKQ
jgi:hypothetical protein